MKKQAKYLEDSYLDYRSMARFFLFAVICFVAVWVISGPILDIIRGDSTRKIDAVPYLENVKKLVIINNGYSMIPIRYTEFSPVGYESNSSKITPEFTKSADGTEVIMTFGDDDRDHLSSLYIHGPALEALEIRGPVEVSYNGTGALAVVNQGGTFSYLGSTREKISIINTKGATSRFDYGVHENLDVTLDGGRVTTGRVVTLSVHMPECKEKSPRSVAMVESVTSGKMIYNDVEQPAQSATSQCSSLAIGSSL